MSPADSPTPAPTASAVTGPRGRYFPAIDEELAKRVDLPAGADEDAIRRAVADRRRLYESRIGPESPRPVRQQNTMLLAKLDQLAPAFEAYIAAVRAWRLLSEASEALDQRAWARCRHRLDEATALLQNLPQEALRSWSADLRADLEDQGAPALEPAEDPSSKIPVAEPVAATPLVLAPSEAPGQVGHPFSCAFAVHPPGLAVSAVGLPAGLDLDGDSGRIIGTPTIPGEYSVELQVAGNVGARMLLKIAPAPAAARSPASTPAVPAPMRLTASLEPAPIPAATAPPAAPRSFSLTLPDNRRVHIFAGPRVRCGRATDCDLAIACVVRGNPAATVAATKEISRQHCEIVLQGNQALIHDGWTSQPKASTFGCFLEVHRVPLSGMAVANGQVLKFTSRPLGPNVVHWRVMLVEQASLREAPAAFVPALSAGPRLAALWLRRLDDVPDDILIVQSVCDLQALGVGSAPCWLRPAPEGWLIGNATGIAAISELQKFLPGAVATAPGVMRPHSPREVLDLASRG